MVQQNRKLRFILVHKEVQMPNDSRKFCHKRGSVATWISYFGETLNLFSLQNDWFGKTIEHQKLTFR